MNPNFNVKLGLRHPEGPSPGLHFLNNCVKRVSARMMHKFRKPSAKSLNKDTSLEGMRIFFGTDVLGSGDTNTMRIMLGELLAFERNVEVLHYPTNGTITVSFLGEEETFNVTEFTIVSINADQKSSYVEFEVKVCLGGA